MPLLRLVVLLLCMFPKCGIIYLWQNRKQAQSSLFRRGCFQLASLFLRMYKKTAWVKSWDNLKKTRYHSQSSAKVAAWAPLTRQQYGQEPLANISCFRGSLQFRNRPKPSIAVRWLECSHLLQEAGPRAGQGACFVCAQKGLDVTVWSGIRCSGYKVDKVWQDTLVMLAYNIFSHFHGKKMAFSVFTLHWWFAWVQNSRFELGGIPPIFSFPPLESYILFLTVPRFHNGCFGGRLFSPVMLVYFWRLQRMPFILGYFFKMLSSTSLSFTFLICAYMGMVLLHWS